MAVPISQGSHSSRMLGVSNVNASPSPYAATNAEAFDALEAWIRRSPSERSVWTLDRTAGKWRVGLTTSSERLSAGVGDTLAAAARAALAIADAAGYL